MLVKCVTEHSPKKWLILMLWTSVDFNSYYIAAVPSFCVFVWQKQYLHQYNYLRNFFLIACHFNWILLLKHFLTSYHLKKKSIFTSKYKTGIFLLFILFHLQLVLYIECLHNVSGFSQVSSVLRQLFNTDGERWVKTEWNHCLSHYFGNIILFYYRYLFSS